MVGGLVGWLQEGRLRVLLRVVGLVRLREVGLVLLRDWSEGGRSRDRQEREWWEVGLIVLLTGRWKKLWMAWLTGGGMKRDVA